jgi:hypothetical protein
MEEKRQTIDLDNLPPASPEVIARQERWIAGPQPAPWRRAKMLPRAELEKLYRGLEEAGMITKEDYQPILDSLPD